MKAFQSRAGSKPRESDAASDGCLHLGEETEWAAGMHEGGQTADAGAADAESGSA
jgi:hypothetical protein